HIIPYDHARTQTGAIVGAIQRRMHMNTIARHIVNSIVLDNTIAAVKVHGIATNMGPAGPNKIGPNIMDDVMVYPEVRTIVSRANALAITSDLAIPVGIRNFVVADFNIVAQPTGIIQGGINRHQDMVGALQLRIEDKPVDDNVVLAVEHDGK